VDADIVFWDGGFRFFAGTSGCSGGFYIEDIAAHEFGHALGLGHSTVTSATMYPSTSACNTANRSLDADDVAGVRALYPPSSMPVPPTAPTGLRIAW
jgi:matrix metalloproteinase-20 (enamelysin)